MLFECLRHASAVLGSRKLVLGGHAGKPARPPCGAAKSAPMSGLVCGAMRALWRDPRGAFPLLPLVCGTAAPEDRRVLLAASTRRRQSVARDALPHGGSARPLQRLEREWRGRRRRLARRARGRTSCELPAAGQAAGVSARRSSTGSRKTTSSNTLENGLMSLTP